MTSAFDDEHGSYVVLRNNMGEYSLWPSDVDVPDGWQPVLGPDSRSACLAHVEQNWSMTAAAVR
jgi:uncharacterized protein YbdZ (MbtH family)